MLRGICFLVLISFCLVASEGARPLIVGGKVASKRYRKYLGYLQLQFKDGGRSSCTGTILGRRWILTAAHCVDDYGSSQDVDVSNSFTYISPRSARKNLGKKYFFRAVFVHKRYKAGTEDSRHDIALVELLEDIKGRKYFPVTLGAAPIQGTEVIGAGYGALDEDGTDPRYAMQTTVIAQDFETCASRESGSTRRLLSNRLQVCATSIGFPDIGTTDTCYGDSGGPLFTTGRNGGIVQYAITSFSTTGCAEPGGTPWYVRAVHYKKKLEKIMRKGRHSQFKKFI